MSTPKTSEQIRFVLWQLMDMKGIQVSSGVIPLDQQADWELYEAVMDAVHAVMGKRLDAALIAESVEVQV